VGVVIISIHTAQSLGQRGMDLMVGTMKPELVWVAQEDLN
jgi:hypothetical protein